MAYRPVDFFHRSSHALPVLTQKLLEQQDRLENGPRKPQLKKKGTDEKTEKKEEYAK